MYSTRVKKSIIVMCSIVLSVFSQSCDSIEDIFEDFDINKGLVFYSTFDNETANNTVSNGSPLNGVFVNSPKLIDDTPNGVGKSVLLNGFKEEAILIPGNPIGKSENYAMSMWIKDFLAGCIVHGVLPTYEDRYTRLSFIADEHKNFVYYSDYVSHCDHVFTNYNYSSIQDGRWHLLTINVNFDKEKNNRTIQFYVDGVLIDNASVGTIGTEERHLPIKIKIGSEDDAINNFKVDNFRLYNRTLDPKEVKMIYDFERK